MKEEHRINHLSSLSVGRAHASNRHTYSRVEVAHLSSNDQMSSTVEPKRARCDRLVAWIRLHDALKPVDAVVFKDAFSNGLVAGPALRVIWVEVTLQAVRIVIAKGYVRSIDGIDRAHSRIVLVGVEGPFGVTAATCASWERDVGQAKE